MKRGSLTKKVNLILEVIHDSSIFSLQGIAQPNPIAGGVGFGTPLPALVPAGGGGGVSINPGGRGGGGGGGGVPSAGAHGGSMESLNSTNSSTLSQLSYGSTISTGERHRELTTTLKFKIVYERLRVLAPSHREEARRRDSHSLLQMDLHFSVSSL